MTSKEKTNEVPMSFLKTFIAVCRGPGCFSNIIKNYSLRRTFLHLFLFALTISFLITNCRYVGFAIGDNRKLIEFELFTFRYLGNPAKKSLSATADSPHGMIWTPRIAVSFFEMSDEESLIIPFMIMSDTRPQTETVKTAQLDSKLHEYLLKYGAKEDLAELGYKQFVVTTLWFIFCVSVLKILFCALLFPAMFAMVFNLTSRSRTVKASKFSRLWIVAIYAGFPAGLIAAFFPAFNLAYADYQSVYVFALLTYLLVIFYQLERKELKNTGKNLSGTLD